MQFESTKRVARHKSNTGKGLECVNIGLTYVLVGRGFRKENVERGKNMSIEIRSLNKVSEIFKFKGK
jgi:hypothetical protein